MSIFTKTPISKPASNGFSLAHDVKLSLDAGYLVPTCCVELIPGDVVNYNNTVMMRLAPMVAPVMHKMDVSTHSFFVPVRLLWDGYEKFFASGIPSDNTPVAPYISGVDIQLGSLGDYLGLPTNYVANADGTPGRLQYSAGIDKFSALPFSAYQKIYNDYYRDENLSNDGDEVPYKLTDGSNNSNWPELLSIRKRAWQHDYFTSSLPWAQKGEAVALPMGDYAPLAINKTGVGSDALQVYDEFGTALGLSFVNKKQQSELPPDDVYVDLESNTATTINTLRWAIKLQEFLEKNARGGTRYIELMKAHFGVQSSDARLQRAEFLGGATNPVVISEVLQTSESKETTTPLGEMAGHGLSVGRGRSTRYFAEEHGFFITIMSVRPKTAYQQGIAKMWSRWSPLDYAFPSFAHLGEQEVLNREVYYAGDADDDKVFGYIPRYAEYRYENSRVAGDFRNNLSHWHMGRIFDSRPALNGQFIEADPTKRIFAVNTPSTNVYYAHVMHNLQIRRRLPKYGIPSL